MIVQKVQLTDFFGGGIIRIEKVEESKTSIKEEILGETYHQEDDSTWYHIVKNGNGTSYALTYFSDTDK